MRLLASLLATTILLAGCTVGPDYAGPPGSASDAVARGSFVRAGDEALNPAPPLAEWWTALGDPTLDALVSDALAHSPTIDQATARIREAQAALGQQRASQLPAVSASAMYAHAELPGIDIGAAEQGEQEGGEGSDTIDSLDFFNLGLTASWEPDLFGGRRRAVEQASATLDARYADLSDAQVSLSAQVADAYVSLRDVQARIALNARSAELQARQVELTRQRYEGGTASLLDVERLQNQLEGTRADAIPLGTQADQYLNLLAILTGRTPGALDGTLGTAVPVPLPPASVPIGDPGALIGRRPDIRAAERQLAAGTAGIGVARARELPGISLMGILGLGGTNPGDMFDPGNLTALALPQLSWNLLDFGAARAATQQSEAQRDLAEAQYRQTVLEALQDAEDSLSRFGNSRAQLGRLAQVQLSADRSAALNGQRVAAGTSTLIDQLDIERQQVSAAIAVEQAKAQLALAYIAVNKALGLGWSEAEPPAP